MFDCVKLQFFAPEDKVIMSSNYLDTVPDVWQSSLF